MENISRAIFHTLMHSMWQGLILALLTGLIMVSTRKQTASLRYHLLTGALFLFTATVVYTLVIELKAGGLESHQAAGPLIQQHAGMFVTAWFMLALIKGFRLSLGLYTLNRLHSVKISPMSPFWEERFKALTKTMKIAGPVALFESGIARVPLLIGYLKPVILIPIGLVNSLEPAQVEAILLHELAHIVRRDYLVNLIQKIIESLLFFNPAVLWISHLIRCERENCCDDIAIGQTQNRVGYMRALISFEEFRKDLPGHALAFSGNTGTIPRRIERMISGKNRSLLKVEVIILSLMTILFIAASSRIPLPFAHPHSPSTHMLLPSAHTPPLSTHSTPASPPSPSDPQMSSGDNCTTCPYMHPQQLSMPAAADYLLMNCISPANVCR